MRTLEQIRNDNKIESLLFNKMQERPEQIPSQIMGTDKKVYDEFLKPISRRVYERYIEKNR